MVKFKFKLPFGPPTELLKIELLNVDQTPDGRLVADVRFTVLVPFE
jgi:hypothetical protein